MRYFEDKNGMTLWMTALAFRSVALEWKGNESMPPEPESGCNARK